MLGVPSRRLGRLSTEGINAERSFPLHEWESGASGVDVGRVGARRGDLRGLGSGRYDGR